MQLKASRLLWISVKHCHETAAEVSCLNKAYHMVQDAWFDDPWLSTSEVSRTNASGKTSLRIESIRNVGPLDAQLGVASKKTIPDALADALFGQPEPTIADINTSESEPDPLPSLRTFAILDAAKVTNLPELLERSDLEHRCLFKGQAYDDLKNVAPWIVQLEPDNAFTRHLFTRSDADWHIWDAAPGIYLRSQKSLDLIWRHFRKFTRIQDEQGKWYYFRLWEPRWTAHVMQALPEDQAQQIMSPLFAIYAIDPGPPATANSIRFCKVKAD